MGPKMHARILRFRRALRLANSGIGIGAAAARSGYADHAHFSRDCRSLTGLTPTELLPRVGNVQDVVAGTF
jgi:AraC-like DNA-binding protein